MVDLCEEDARARRQALDTRKSFIVQAPAGSGKTSLLMNRYLALLALVEQPEEVVAITFTRKATGELRDRVLAALAATNPALEAINQDQELPEHVALTARLAEHVRRRDRDLGWGIEQQPDRLRIQTIDALCAGVSAQMPWMTPFGGDVTPVDDAEPLYQEAAQGVLEFLDDEQWGDAVATVFAHLDNDALRLRRLLVEMLAKRDQWLRHLFATATEPATQRAELEGALAKAVSLALAELKAALPVDGEQELFALANAAAHNCREHGRDSPVVACHDAMIWPDGDRDLLSLWQGFAHLLLTNDGAWRARFTVNEGFPPGRDEVNARLKQRAKDLVAGWSGDDVFRGRLAGVRKLPKSEFSDAQWQVLHALVGVLQLAAGLLRVEFRNRGCVDFIELTTAAQEALGSFEQPGELSLALDYRIAHILVDEYQDTSKSHQLILDGLTAGWEPGDGRTLFLVGDPMQSIYRFREAEVGLFLQAQTASLANVDVVPLVLHANYRSVEPLVAWYNDIFARLFPARSNISTGAVEYRCAVAANRDDTAGGACVHALTDASEPALVCALIREARSLVPQGSIAIMVRSRSHLTALLPALDAAGIVYRGVDIEPLGSVQVVQDLLSIARALLHPADRVAWLAVLRAPWCGLLLADLHTLVEGATQFSIESLLNDSARLALLSEDGRARALNTQAVLGEAMRGDTTESLRRRVERAWLRLAGPACVDAVQLSHAEAFFTLLGDWEARGEDLDQDSLRAQLARFYAPSPVAAADVEIMTMHKAKGLEFDTVIVPGMERIGRSDTRPLLSWSEQIYPGGATDLLLAPIPRDDTEDLPAYDYIHRLNRDKQDLELDRLLYVAATRAKRYLHFVGTVERDPDGVPKTPRTGSLLSRLWPLATLDFDRRVLNQKDERAAAEREVSAEDQPTTWLRRLPSGWQPPPPPVDVVWTAPLAPVGTQENSDIIEFDWASFTARQTGVLAHRVLKNMADEGLSAWSAARLDARQRQWRRVLASQGVLPEQLDGAVRRLQRALQGMLKQPRAQWILAAHAAARSEYALTGVVDGKVRHAVMDRTFIDEQGTRWIIDYKTGDHEGSDVEAFLNREQERYRSQLEGYAALLEKLDDRPIRLGLYYPLLNGWREWSRHD